MNAVIQLKVESSADHFSRLLNRPLKDESGVAIVTSCCNCVPVF